MVKGKNLGVALNNLLVGFITDKSSSPMFNGVMFPYHALRVSSISVSIDREWYKIVLAKVTCWHDGDGGI